VTWRWSVGDSRISSLGRRIISWVAAMIRTQTRKGRDPMEKADNPRASQGGGQLVILRLLGGFSLEVDERDVDVPTCSQRVLVYLALHERPQARTRLAGSLWPDRSDGQAGACLRSALWRLPRPARRLVEVDACGRTLTIASDVRIDLREAEAFGWALTHDPLSTAEPGSEAAFFNELMPGWYEDWVVIERERIDQLWMLFLEVLVDAFLRRGAHAEALDVALRLVAADPLRDGSQRALIRVYESAGNHGQAARQVERYRALMADELGGQPSFHPAFSIAIAEKASFRG
jgi:DNA-binding SARP family transcriptional activator